MNPIIDHIIAKCKKQDPTAQKALYDQYKDRLLGVCVRYIKSTHEAEDVFIHAFYKILTKINDYSGNGSFEGWMRKIMVNESLMYLRKNKSLYLTVEIPDQDIADTVEDDEDSLLFDEVMAVLNDLPAGYRTVFNLYVFEEFKHREIAEMLGISINTSKSQLILAKKRIQELLKKKQNLISKYNNI